MSFVSAANDNFVSFFAFLRKGRVFATQGYPVVRVNLGSGLSVADGWINVDVTLSSLVAGWPNFVRRAVFRIMPKSSGIRRHMSEKQFCDVLRSNTFVHHNATYGLPFRDGSVDYIYTSHFLEHLFLSDTRSILRESRRVLKPNGVIRIVIPDLAYVLGLFSKGEKEAALSYFFYDQGPSYFTRHKYMYDFELLKKELLAAGFVNVEERPFRQGAVPDLNILDGREGESLHVEAISP